jgi:tRNA uridine 5-carboxymethylaminomethyl modification enzyme
VGRGQAESSPGADNRSRPTSEDCASAVGQSLAQLLKRPEITMEHLLPILGESVPGFFERDEISLEGRGPAPGVSSRISSSIRNDLKAIETEIKYEGYLVQQQRSIERLKKAEQHTIPLWFDYGSVSGLSREMQEKLIKIRPRTLGHASRIPGVTPAAVSLVQVYIEIQTKRREHAAAI